MSSDRVELNEAALEAVNGGELSFEKLSDGMQVIRRRDVNFNIVGTWQINEDVISANDLAQLNKDTYNGDVATLKRYLSAGYITYIGKV